MASSSYSKAKHRKIGEEEVEEEDEDDTVEEVCCASLFDLLVLIYISSLFLLNLRIASSKFFCN